MKEKKRLEITRETSEITRISFRADHSATFFCPACAAETAHLKISEAAAAARVSETTVFRLAEAGSLHSTETRSGALLICGLSLAVKI